MDEYLKKMGVQDQTARRYCSLQMVDVATDAADMVSADTCELSFVDRASPLSANVSHLLLYRNTCKQQMATSFTTLSYC